MKERLWKIKDKKIWNLSVSWWIKAFVMALLPLLCCLVSCALQGKSMGDIYLPANDWNDELFYFKQVEAMVENGYPYGYFGYNESHALKLSLGPWSPILVWPWVLWGLVFGWNLMAPVWCNLFLMTLAIFLFVILVKPTNKQLGILAVLYCLFPLFTRYIFSAMPETICFSMLIVFYGLAVNYLKFRRTNGKLLGLFALSAIMTLMRPYLLLFMLLPAFLWIKKCRKWWSVAGSVGVMALTFGVYAVMIYYFTPEYLTPIYSTEWVDVFLEEGLFPGIRFMLGTIWHRGMEFAARIYEAFRSGLAEGVFFVAFTVVLLILFWETLRTFLKKRETEWIVFGHGALALIGMLAALLLMYGMKDGSKHLLSFVVMGIFLISIMETKYFAKAAIMGVMLVYFFFLRADSLYEYKIPFATPEKVECMEYWDQVFREEIDLELDNVPNYHNSIIWVLTDSKIDEEEEQLTEWQPLYFIPRGMGINCCYSSYVKENVGRLKCGYVGTRSEGQVDYACREAGYEEIGRRDGFVVYRTK